VEGIATPTRGRGARLALDVFAPARAVAAGGTAVVGVVITNRGRSATGRGERITLRFGGLAPGTRVHPAFEAGHRTVWACRQGTVPRCVTTAPGGGRLRSGRSVQEFFTISPVRGDLMDLRVAGLLGGSRARGDSQRLTLDVVPPERVGRPRLAITSDMP